ncbi:MAG: hypothetical protein WCR21_06250 [Bacteroidota bacterium]
MKLKIDPSKKISSIKEEFNAAFPFLRLEFFNRHHKINALSSKKDMITKDAPLNELKHIKHNHIIEITEEMQVQVLEQLFQKEFGIATQVFRKSGKSWLETSVTDDWTLKRQNEEGMELSRING